jgi:hypothetical protein
VASSLLPTGSHQTIKINYIMMKINKTSSTFFFLFFLPVWLMAQSENIDLSMIYKIKQERFKNSIWR